MKRARSPKPSPAVGPALLVLASLLPGAALAWFVGEHVGDLFFAYVGALGQADLEQAISPLSLALAVYTLVLWGSSRLLAAGAKETGQPYADVVAAYVRQRLS